MGCRGYNLGLQMARKESMHALMNRWDRIFDGIRKGKNAGEIYRREGIIAQKKYEAWANKRGERSEEKFERSIKSLSFVVDVRQTVKNSDEDYHQKKRTLDELRDKRAYAEQKDEESLDALIESKNKLANTMKP